MKNRSVLVTVGIVSLGVVLGLLILVGVKPSATTANHGDEEAQHEKGAKGQEKAAKGPHGGRLLSSGDFALEVSIFEKGVSPEFRIYAFEKGRPVEPAEVKLQIRLERLGSQPEMIGFRKESDFLRGEQTIVEPHSFRVSVMAERKGQAFQWAYEQSEGRVRMDDAMTKSAGIELRTAGPAKIRSTLQLQGEIQFNQDRLAHVVPRLAGVVVKSAKNLGDTVKKGELLAILESQTLADLKSEHFATQTRLDLAQSNFEREKRLWEEKISAQQDYFASRQALAEVQIAHRNVEQKLLALGLDHAAVMRGGADGLTRYEIRAPIDGVVTEKHLALGEAVKEDASIFTIADLSSVWAELTIYPKDLSSVKLGQKVMVRASALNAEAAGQGGLRGLADRRTDAFGQGARHLAQSGAQLAARVVRHRGSGAERNRSAGRRVGGGDPDLPRLESRVRPLRRLLRSAAGGTGTQRRENCRGRERTPARDVLCRDEQLRSEG